MANTVQDKVKTEWQQVQSEGGQRLGRIRDIFKAASSEALGELKAGTDEIQTLSRKSLAEMIAQLRETEVKAATADSIVLETEVETKDTGLVVSEESETQDIPTWRQLFVDFWHIANDRKGEWSKDVLARLQIQINRFDTEMTKEYGERYRPFQRLVKLILALVDAAYNRLNREEDASKPVSIEILDSDITETPSSQADQS